MAAKSRIAGITIEIGGDTTKLDKALSGVDKHLSATQSKLKDVEKLLKLNPGNTELLTQKQKLLADAIGSTEERLQKLKEAQANSTKPEEWDTLQREITETENNLESLKKEMKDFGSVSEQKIKAAGQKMQEVGNKISSIGASLTTKFTLPIAAAFTAAGKSASDYEENLNKIDVAFGDSADEVKKWAETATKQFGLSKVAATEATAGFGALSKGIGLSEKSAAEVSTTLAGLSSDLASYFNTGTDVSAKALEGIFTGESEALKKFGVVMTDTNLQKFAADHGMVWKEASQSEKVMLRYQYVLEKTKDAQGDYSRTADGTANSFRTFQATLQNLATTLGQKLLPIITPIVQKITTIVEKFSNLSPQAQDLIVKIGLMVAAIGPLMQVLGPVISLSGTALTHIPKFIDGAKKLKIGVQALAGILGTGGPVILAITAAIAAGVLIYKNWDKIKAAAKKLGTALSKAWNGIKSAASKAWDAVKNTVSKAWTGIKTAVSNGANAVKTSVSNRMTQVKTAMGTAWTNVKTAAGTAWSQIRTSVSNGAKTVVDSVSNRMRSVKETVKTTWDNVKTTIGSRLSSIASSAASTFNNVKNKVANAFRNVQITNPFTKLVSAAQSAISRVKSLFNVRLKFPSIKMPHFSISGRFSLNQPSVPHINVRWYKKAYQNPYLFSSPTVLQTPHGFKGFGDGSGGELVYGRNQLLRDIAQASGGDTIYNVNIYGSEGMNVNQLAAAVQNRLVALQRQKELACV
jgi:phage-related minor tail protein